MIKPLSFAFVLGVVVPLHAAVLGVPPDYTSRAISEVPNQEAIRARIYAPGLSDGFVPQGVAVVDGALWVATYQSRDRSQNRGPCRVFKIDASDGRVIGDFAMPVECGHANGITYAGDGILYVADARHLFRVDVRKALADGRCAPTSCVTFTLPASLHGAALGYANGTLWFAPYRKAGNGTARLWQVSEYDLRGRAARGDVALDTSVARGGLPLADRTQGIAIAADGAIWVTQSGGDFGRLQRVDPTNGAVTASYAMPGGIEDIEFDASGTLWAVSEAGSQRWSTWRTFFPFVFSLDTSRLIEEGRDR